MGISARARNRWLICITLLVGSGFLIKDLGAHAIEVTFDLPGNVMAIQQQTFFDRQVKTYGYCSGIGYGYIRKIMEGIPDPSFFPVTRYKDWTRNAHLYFLYRYDQTDIDDRMMIGINFRTEHLTESPIEEAVLVSRTEKGRAVVTIWGLTTHYVNDELAGFRFHIEGMRTKGPQFISGVFMESPDDRTVLEKFSLPVTAPKETVDYRFNEPFKRFSTLDGREPFVLIVEMQPLIEGGSASEITKIEALITKVNLDDYRIVDQERGCFAAFRNDFYLETMGGGPSGWKTYIESIQNG